MIIGAPRSGTNMLRDLLVEFDGVGTWPCDEINYIWRHGNVNHRSDEFTPEMATSKVARYVRKQFDWVAQAYDVKWVVEKTCANSLRVPFVERVLPEARYIFIRRDGLDAVGSAAKRWKADLDVPYLARKTRFVPLSDLPYYGGRYLWNRVHRLFSRSERLAFWGPQLEGMASLLREYSLEEVCALQWRACVDKASEAFSLMPAEQWIEVGYEDFVRSPESELGRVLQFLGIDANPGRVRSVIEGVRADSVGKGRAALDDETAQRLQHLVGDTLKRFRYM